MATVAANTTSTGFERHKFTADEYHRMGEAGIFTEDDRVELIEGDIIQMAPVGDPHVNAVDRLNEVFVIAVAGKARVSVQNPVRLSPRSEPQPDLLILRRESFGRAGLPEDVLVLVEVSDTTLRYDRDVKLPLYARHAVPHVLNVDITGEAVVHFSEPDADGYRRSERHVR
jgi:Uma2 family endonuclease